MIMLTLSNTYVVQDAHIINKIINGQPALSKTFVTCNYYNFSVDFVLYTIFGIISS